MTSIPKTGGRKGPGDIAGFARTERGGAFECVGGGVTGYLANDDAAGAADGEGDGLGEGQDDEREEGAGADHLDGKVDGWGGMLGCWVSWRRCWVNSGWVGVRLAQH